MTNPNTPPAVEAEVLTPEQYEQARREAEGITTDVIDSITVNLPPLQSAPMVAKQTFAKFFGVLKTLRTAYADAPIDTTTTAGEKAAREVWRKLVTLRTRSDKVRLSHNRVFIEQQKANNDEYGMLVDTILPIEKRYEDAIREKERAVEAARVKREEEARQKAAGITQFILDIGSHTDNLTGLSSGDIEARIQAVKLIELVEGELEHRFGEAVTIKDRTIDRLEAAHAEKLQAEKDAEQVKADRERFTREQAERDAREVAEREARNAIGEINDDLAQAPDLDAATLGMKIEHLQAVVIDHYAPLQAEARAAIDRVLPAIRKIREDKIKAAADRTAALETAARAEKESNARQRIAAMKALVADCVGSSSLAIELAIKALDGLLLAEFEPFAKEAEEEQGRVRTALSKLLLAARAEERTTAEKKAEETRLAEEARAKAERAASINARIDALSSTTSRLKGLNADSKRIGLVLAELPAPDEANYGERVEDARVIYSVQKESLAALFNLVHAAEQEADRIVAQKLVEVEANRLEEAKRSRVEAAIQESRYDMHAALQTVRDDPAFSQLNGATQAKVADLLEAIRVASAG